MVPVDGYNIGLADRIIRASRVVIYRAHPRSSLPVLIYVGPIATCYTYSGPLKVMARVRFW